MPVAGYADREHIVSLGSRTDLLGCTSVSDVGISIGLILLEGGLHGVLVREAVQPRPKFSHQMKLLTFESSELYSN